MSNIYEDYRERLLSLAETKYSKFIASLVPGTDNILGVRMPILKKLAKELARDNWREYFGINEDKYYEETMLQGLTIGFLKESLETVLEETRKFVPKINNWAVCDSFCTGLKIARKNKERIWDFLSEYLMSDKPYDLRFAIVLMMDCFICEEYAPEMLERLDKVKNDDYYVKMAVAWAVSMCYVEYPEITMPYLKNNSLDDFTYNKSLQKICESLKPKAEEKALIKSMKRPAKPKTK